jgi:formate dehydrogenase subunit gamma
METMIAARLRARRRAFVWGIVLVLAVSVLLPTAVTWVAAQSVSDAKPEAAFWRAVREGASGYSAVRGPEAGVLIDSRGEDWRALRNGPVAGWGAAAMGGVVALLLLYTVLHGRVRIEGGRSGRTVPRWSVFNRTLHWYTAILFIILAITGLSLLYGRAVLIPWMGLEAFSVYAAFSKVVHNYLGPAFAVGVVLILVLWLRFNLPEPTDWQWLKSGGGLIGKGKHPHCGFMNPGEKIFTYGSMLVLGLVVVVTGFILDFPNFPQPRETYQLSQLLHDAAALAWITLMLGHIYLGLWGVEGALEGMVSGEVDENWAKQHHDLWYEQVKREHPARETVRGSREETGAGRSPAA